MKIVIPSIRDTGGTGWNLAHAINSVARKNHQAVDMTAQKSYINYPTMMDMGNYSKSLCRKIIENSDVIAFLGSFRPLYDGLRLSPHKLKDKKKIAIFMGSEWRHGRKELLEHADKYLKSNYKLVVGSPCMLMPGEDADKTPTPKGVEWLPLTRGFHEISQKYGTCNQDQVAIDNFGVPKRRVTFMHAPTSEERKGSNTFYRAMTLAQQLVPYLNFANVRGQPWVTCLQHMATCDLLFDQDPPFPETYGGISVEASIFKLPIISRINPYAIDFWKKECGLDSPIIQWKDDDDLFKKVYLLATHPEERKAHGLRTYKFMKAIHDERPVVDRFFQITDQLS